MKDNTLPVRALPLDEESSEGYEMPEDYGQALAYLKGVRSESQATPHLFISARSQGVPEEAKGGRDLAGVSLSRLVFQPSEGTPQGVYQDADIVVGKHQSCGSEHPLWKQAWIDQVIQERQKTRQRLLQLQSD